MKLLFIGRFQPFHKKHLEIIIKTNKKLTEHIICIAAAQESYTKKNPFTYCEREHMIMLATREAGIKDFHIKIIPLPDINDEKNWVDYVKKVVGDFDLVITNNPKTKQLFEDKGYLVSGVNISDDGSSGTFVRDEIAKHTNLWEIAVPKSVIKYIMEIKGDKRIRSIYDRDVIS